MLYKKNDVKTRFTGKERSEYLQFGLCYTVNRD